MANTENVPIDKLSSKEETTNYCRIILLIVDVGTETLLQLFYSLVPKCEVKSYFASKKLEIEEGQKKKVFDKSQYIKLTCPAPNPDEFDISLMIKLLTYFKLSPVKLDNLRIVRNEIVGHPCRAKLIKQDFESLWVKVESILLNIAGSLSRDEEQITKGKITKLKENVLDDLDIEKEIKIFEIWCQEEIAVLQEKSDKHQEEIAVLHEKSDQHQEEIAVLHEKSHQHQEEVAVLHEIMQSLHDEVKGIQHTQSKPNGENLSAEEQTILKMLQHDLITYYRELLSKLQLSPLFDEEGYAADFFDFYVKPILTIPNQPRAEGQPQSTPVKTCHDIFVRNSKPYTKIYISSHAGCGKTSFLTYLTLIWCQAHLPVGSDNQGHIAVDVNEMRTFMLLFFIHLRDSHENECDVDIMIQQFLCRLANSDKYAQSGFIQKLLHNAKCIILLDGLDEWNHPQEKQCFWPDKHIPHSRARPLCTTLTTSRPWKIDVVELKPGVIDLKLELNGLEKDLLKCLIGNVVTTMNKLCEKEMKADDFEQKLREMKLTALSKIPVVVMQLLTVWFDNEPLGESQCEIYSNMIEFLLKRYCTKRKIVSEIEDIKVDDCSRDRQTPMCLQKKIHCKAHMELLSVLATLAYNTLFTDNEESSLVFDRKIAKKYLTDKEIEMSLAVGILTQEKVIGKMSKRQSHISFIHKTFQEYLAALYVALSPRMVTNVEEKIKHVCCSIGKILEMSQIFMFLSGLCPEVMVNLHEHLRQTVSEDNRTQKYRASFELRPSWLSGGDTLWKVQDTMVEWLGECWLNGHKHVTHLPVSDFFIWSPRNWSAEVKSLTVHNPVCSLYVRGNEYSPEETKDILNSVTVFNSIQKLWLQSISEDFIVQLVSQHKHSFSVRPDTWRHLECVTLDCVMDGNIPDEILCSLVDSILLLPKIVHVSLEDCSIIQGTRDLSIVQGTRDLNIGQGTRDWKTYILSHPCLAVDIDKDDLLQFHTAKV